MQSKDKNEVKKPDSAPKDPQANKELSETELASIAAGQVAQLGEASTKAANGMGGLIS